MPHNVAGVQPFIAEGESVPVSITGTTAEVELSRIVIPQYSWTRGTLRVSALLSLTNNANAKTLRLRVGSLAGTVLGAAAVASMQVWNTVLEVFATPTQYKMHQWMSLGGGAVALGTAAANWTAPSVLILSGQLAVGTDTMTLEGVSYQGYKF